MSKKVVQLFDYLKPSLHPANTYLIVRHRISGKESMCKVMGYSADMSKVQLEFIGSGYYASDLIPVADLLIRKIVKRPTRQKGLNYVRN